MARERHHRGLFSISGEADKAWAEALYQNRPQPRAAERTTIIRLPRRRFHFICEESSN